MTAAAARRVPSPPSPGTSTACVFPENQENLDFLGQLGAGRGGCSAADAVLLQALSCWSAGGWTWPLMVTSVAQEAVRGSGSFPPGCADAVPSGNVPSRDLPARDPRCLCHPSVPAPLLELSAPWHRKGRKHSQSSFYIHWISLIFFSLIFAFFLTPKRVVFLLPLTRESCVPLTFPGGQGRAVPWREVLVSPGMKSWDKGTKGHFFSSSFLSL